MPILCNYVSKCTSTAATGLPVGTVLMWSLAALPGVGGQLGDETWAWYGAAEGRLVLGAVGGAPVSSGTATNPAAATTGPTTLTPDHIPNSFQNVYGGGTSSAPDTFQQSTGPYQTINLGGGQGHNHPLPTLSINLIVRTA